MRGCGRYNARVQPSTRLVQVARPEGISQFGPHFTTTEGIWLTGVNDDLIDDACMRFVGVDGNVRTVSLPDSSSYIEPVAGGDFAFASSVADARGYLMHYVYYKHVRGESVELFTHPDLRVSFHDGEDACVRGQEIFTCSSGKPIGRFEMELRSIVYPTPTGWLLMRDLFDPDEDVFQVAGFTLTGELVFDMRTSYAHNFDRNAHVAFQDYRRGDLVILDTARGTERDRIAIGEHYQTRLSSAGDVLLVEQTYDQLTPYRDGERGDPIAVPGGPTLSGPIAYIDSLWTEGTLAFVLPP